MMTVIALVHLIVCALLIALVLLQDPKSAGTGSVFGGGGGSSSLLGATGAVTFLTRLTRYSAVVFGFTCLLLSLGSRPKVGSVFDAGGATAPTEQSVPAAPAAPADAGAQKAPAAPTDAAPPAGK